MSTRINLKKDAERVRKDIQRRVKEYPVYINPGPGEDNADIRLITLGFSFDQAGWVTLVFDTRPDAELDGECQAYIEETKYPFKGWFKAFDQVQEQKGVLSITGHSGSRHAFLSSDQMETVANCFGTMCRDVLVEARDNGVFQSLPLADDCQLAVEEHGGFYGWIEAQGDEQETSEDSLRAAMEDGARLLSGKKKIDYWIEQLDRSARGEDYPDGRFPDGALSLRAEFILEHLDDVAQEAAIPLLTWANRWAGQPEFKTEVPMESPSQIIVFDVFESVRRCGHVPPDAEVLLQQYVRTASQVPPIMHVRTYSKPKQPKPLYGILAYHAAQLLHDHFPGYAEPKRSDSTNQLLNAKSFYRSDARE